MVYPSGNPESICDPYCIGLTPPLTFSPEPCHFMNGSLSSFCDNNGKILKVGEKLIVKRFLKLRLIRI
jgi:hypothetical protein